MKNNNPKIPEHVIKQYGSTHAFRAAKRAALREIEFALNRLRLGCAFLPYGPGAVDRMTYEVNTLKRELSVKNWGR